MNRFEATNHSDAVVPADREAIWAALTDPEVLPRLTPLLHQIDTDGDLWRWHLTRFTILGIGLAPRFTEKMTFDAPRRIEYTHQPPRGRSEPAGTRLEILLTMHVDLPLARAARPAVTRVMRSMMQHTGERFAANLLRHLKVPA